MHQEKIDQYVKTQLKPYEDSAVFTTWLKDSISILNSWGIKWPDDSDLSRLRAELSTTLTGRTKGKLVSKKTVATRIRATKKFYEWLKLQEEDTQQIRLFETTEAGAIEPLSCEDMAVQEVSVPTESERVSEAEGADHGADVQEEGVPTEEKDTPTLSPVDTPEAEYITNTEQKPRRGRKPKAENVDRIQVSVYLSRDVYEGLKALAQVKGLNISDIAARAINRVVDQNSQTITIAQQALRNLATLNVEI